MIVADKPLHVVESGIKSRTFGIALNRKMFRILSADLYSDKIGAVIRELNTNAADAHVAAGKKDKPHVVHLPNHMEPWFEVKDFGTGLDSDAIYSVYTQYGVSNKTDSNEYTGCLGLGSKSPFAYTDSFTVESRVNGKVTHYTAYLNEDGFPSLSDPLTVADTDEENGLTVRFPVKQGDYNAFCDKAISILKWFKVTPTVTGNAAFHYPEKRTFVRKTDTYGLAKKDSYGYSSGGSFVVMGNVAYPISTNEVVTYYAKGDDAKVRQLLEWGVELYVNIGDVDITASRESLSYDDDEANCKRTVPFIKKACLEALKDLETELTKDIDTKPTLWAAREALHQIRNTFPGLDIGGTWNGQAITTRVKVPADKCIVESIKRKSYVGDRLTVKKDNTDEIIADGSPIFLNDGHGGYAAIRRYLSVKKEGQRVYFLSENADSAWLAETGLDTVIIKTSTLPKAERAKGAGRGVATKAKVYEYVGRGNNAADYWKPVEIDLEDDDDFVYVDILYFNYREKPGTDDATRHPNELRYILQTLTAVVGKETKVYGIRPSDKAIMEKSEGTWIPLNEYLDKVQKEASVRLHAEALLAKQYKALGYSTVERMERFKFAADSTFGAFSKKLKVAQAASKNNKVSEYLILCEKVGVTFKEEEISALSVEAETVYEKYPLLKFIDSYSNSDEFRKAAAEYVKMMDGQTDGGL